MVSVLCNRVEHAQKHLNSPMTVGKKLGWICKAGRACTNLYWHDSLLFQGSHNRNCGEVLFIFLKKTSHSQNTCTQFGFGQHVKYDAQSSVQPFVAQHI